MRRLLLTLALVLAFAMTGRSQIHVPDTPVSFDFPHGGWKYLQTISVDKNTTAYLYSYCNRYVVDSKGDTILPHLRIYVRKNYSGSALELAYERHCRQPFQPLNEYMDGLPGSEGIGYIGAYSNFDDHKDYQFKMIYFKVKNTIYEFRLETTRDTYETFEPEFDEILNSITTDGRK